MATRNKNPRRRTKAETQGFPSEWLQDCGPDDQVAVDGILIWIKKTEITISGEQAGRIQKLPGYSVDIAIPDWNKNRSLLKYVKKGYLAQQKMIAKLQGQGASRPWMTERFVEIDKAVAESLSTIAERIKTRRWRGKERGRKLQGLRDVFCDSQRWTQKASRYCQRAEACTDPGEKETVLDAACFSILKVGELINKVERMQHGFWEDFSAAHFLDMRRMRNLLAHTDDLTGEAVIPLGTGIIQDLQTAVQRTLFPLDTGSAKGSYLVSASKLRGLAPSRPREKAGLENSITMIDIDEHERFVIRRVGRTADNKVTFSSSFIGKTNLTIHALWFNASTESSPSNQQD